MKIYLKNFGNILTSRQDGHEAFGAISPQLLNLPDSEIIEIDFEGVGTLTPSWADEFITKIKGQYGNRVVLMDSDNPSVKATLALLQKIKP
jgi:hypothetical protein